MLVLAVWSPLLVWVESTMTMLFDPVVTTLSWLPIAVAVPVMPPTPPLVPGLKLCTPPTSAKDDDVILPSTTSRLPLASRSDEVTGGFIDVPAMPMPLL